jgi:hypothetical protein
MSEETVKSENVPAVETARPPGAVTTATSPATIIKGSTTGAPAEPPKEELAPEPAPALVHAPPKPLPPPTAKCSEGPGNEHEWEVSPEINILICLHCGQRAEATAAVLLYQKVRLNDKKAVEEMKARLNHELKRKDTYVPDLKDCKSELERQLFQDSEYFRKRLDEEMALVTAMKKEVSTANRRVDEMALRVKNIEAANSAVKRQRDVWKEGYNGLKSDLQALTTRVIEEGP